MKKHVLHNVFFPTYILLLLNPIILIMCIFGNIIIDSIVLSIVSLILFKKINKKFFKKYIIKVVGFGFSADSIGLIVCYIPLLSNYFFQSNFSDNGFVIIGFLVSMGLILFFNYAIIFQKSEFDFTHHKSKRIIIALLIAIITAPYTFFIDNHWLMHIFNPIQLLI